MSEFTAVFENKEVKDFIDNLDDKLKKIKNGKKEYVSIISATVFQDVMDHFKEEEGSEGPWLIWTIGYAKKMNELGKSGNKILQDTGKLRNNFLPTKWKSSDKGIYWYNNAKTKSGYSYAWGHNEGDGKLPQRDFMWLSDKALDKISEQTLQFMMEKGI